MRNSWLKARQTKYWAYVSVYVLVVLGGLVIAGVLANRYNKSYDATANKRFTLADQTLKVLDGLNEDVKITMYEQTSRMQQGKELLDRYDNASPHVSVAYIDPEKMPQEARAAGVRTFGTVQVTAGAAREDAKSLTEEEVTNALIRALKGGPRTACVAQGNGEHSLAETGRTGYSSVKELLEDHNYTTKTISLLEQDTVPSDCSILVIGGPRFDYLQPGVDAIKKYVDGGGSALLLLGAPVKMGDEKIGDNEALVDAIKGWGVTLHKNLVFDTNPLGRLFGIGPFVPLVTQYEYHDIVRDMRDSATAYPMVRTMDVGTADKATVSKLFSTSANSRATTELASSEVSTEGTTQGPFTIAAAGKVTVDGGDTATPAADADTTPADAKEGRFVVVGSSDWVSNSYIGLSANEDMFLNMVNWLSSDEELISIRPKDPEDRRLELTGEQMNKLFYFTVFLLPACMILIGLRVWWLRR